MSKGQYYNKPMNGIYFWERNPKGEVGIEVEIEGGPWPDGAPSNWTTHVDNSLRNGGIEYVIRNPVGRDKIRPALEVLEAWLRASNKVFSYRTSIHLHVNIQGLTVRQWVSFIASFVILEEALVDIVGPKRAGNKFCLRACDADEPLRMIRDGLRNEDLPRHLRGDLKYASMNVMASQTHGTLEFRAMEGNLDVAWITAWADVLLALKDYATKVESPIDIVNDMSALGPREWAKRIMPEGNPIVDKMLARDNIEQTLYDGVRIAQDLTYAVPWDKDPIGAVGPVPLAQDDPHRMVEANLDDPVFFDAPMAPPPAAPQAPVRAMEARPIDWARFVNNIEAAPVRPAGRQIRRPAVRPGGPLPRDPFA